MRRATQNDFYGQTQAAVREHGNGPAPNAERPSRAGEIRRVEATLAASGMDISQKYDAFGNNSFSEADNPWAAFFGAPTAPWKTASYDKYDRHSYSLPEAYVGSNLQLAQTIDELIYTDETFYTTELLPYNFTDQISVQWDKWEFNEHFTGIVPEQGVSRLVSSHRESRSESFVRRGLAAIFEHGFMETPQGRANYFLTLAQIARAVQETTNFGVIYAYLTCQNYAKQWEEKHGYFRNRTLRELLERENFMWAIVVKKEFGMEKLDAQIVEWMNAYRASADTWILPPKPAIYLRLVPEEKTAYYKAGQMGPDRVNNIVGAGRPHEANTKSHRIHDIVEPYALFQKNQVFLTRTYHIDRTGPIDLMTRVSSVGEYFKIVKGSSTIDYRNGYRSNQTDTRIYDEDNDCGFTVSKAAGIRFSQVFDENGRPRSNFANSVNPADAKDMDGVFFLRRIVDPSTQNDKYVPIEFCGDIDPAFFGVGDVANLAYAAIANFIPDQGERRNLANALNTGKRLIDELSMLPLDAEGVGAEVIDADTPKAALAGRTTWSAIAQIAASGNPLAQILGDFIRAVEQVASGIGSAMGSTDNIFLNPENSLPIEPYGDGSAARTLYENMLNYRAVPVFRLGENQGDAIPVAANDTDAGLAQAFGFLKQGFLDLDQPENEAIAVSRKLSAESRTGLRNSRAQAQAADTTRDNYNAVRSVLLAHPEWSKGANKTALNAWVKQLDDSLAAAPGRLATARGGRAGQARVQARNSVPTNLAVSEKNPSVVNGNARDAGYALASKFNPFVARDSFETQIPDDGEGGFKRAELIGVQLHDMPVMCGLIGAQTAGKNVGVENYQSASSRRNAGDYDVNAPLDSYFDEEPIGSMFGGRDGGRSQNQLREEINANRVWMPQAGSQLSAQPVNLRFGTMAKNLELLSRSTMEPLAKLVSAMYYGAPWLEQTLTGFEEANIPSPVGILGFRVGMYDMALGIKCKAGGETGYTYFGHSDFMLADDATIKIHYGNYTHYGKSVIHNEKNVFIAYDIFPNRCLGGMGVSPYKSADQFVPSDQLYLADIFYVMVPYTETNFNKVMSMAGRFYTYMDAGMLDEEDPANRELHYSTAPYYNRFWGWYSEEQVIVELDEPMYRRANGNFNTTVWQGEQGTYNYKTEKYDADIIRNKSPWGVTAEGCRAARNGEMDRMPTVQHGILGF